MSNKEIRNAVVEETIVETEQPTEETTVEPIMGTVVDCSRLNVREKPSIESEALCAIDAGIHVLIDEDGSTEDFYKIYTASGIEGYCMKQFIMV